MKKLQPSLPFLLIPVIVCLMPSTLPAATVTESAREIPLAYDVDVVVVGGTTRGVAAAEAAAAEGASVFLAAPRPYLGEDMCATYRLWLNPDEIPASPLGRALFAVPNASNASVIPRGLPYTYTTTPRAGGVHPDTRTPSLLHDGKSGSAAKESVQYDGNVSILADLGAEKPLSKVEVLAFQRDADFVVGQVTVLLSRDKQTWKQAGSTANPKPSGGFEADFISIPTRVEASARYVRVDVTRGKNADRILLGELILHSPEAATSNAPGIPRKARRVTTPMTVKRALDDALLAAKVNFLYGSYVTDLLRDDKGELAGIVMANRSGRQAVRAKVIIDATDRSVAARIAGVDFAEFKPGMYKFSRIVLGGTPSEFATDLQLTYQAGSKPSLVYPVYEHTLELSVRDHSWASIARADQEARNRTWHVGQAAAAESLYQVPPDPVIARARQTGEWPGAKAFDLDTTRPVRTPHLYILGPCADISRPAAEALMRPLHGIALGHRLGKVAAAEARARKLPAVESVRVSSTLPTPGLNSHRSDQVMEADIGEFLNGLRAKPDLKPQPVIQSPAREIPVIASYDTVVVGGGTGGAPAGVGAARGGARTLVIEYLHGLGGVGTLGRISKYYHGNRVGFTAEIDKGILTLAADGKNDSRRGWNIENKMEWLRREIVKAGGDVWYHSLGVGSVVQAKQFVGVVVATPHGRGIVRANTVIDATGNAVIPACAGLETQEIDGEHISVQGTGLPAFTPGESYLNSDWTFTDDDDVLDMWRIHVVGRKKYALAFDQGQLIDTRARRRIVGDIVVSPMDIINQRIYPDVVTVSKSNFDNHGFSSHSLFMITPPDKRGLVGNVPFRSLMPRGYDGILVTGLGMSAHGDAMPVMRMQADVQNQGYASGKASAMAAEVGSTIRSVDVTELQKHLVTRGIIPESLVGAKDSYPYSDEVLQAAVETVGQDFSGIAKVLTDPDRARPMLREAWKKSTTSEARLRYAHVLGMLYDGTGAESLVEAVRQAEWDKGWNFRGMGQFGATTSPVDNLIIALGRTRDPRGLEPILNMLGKLTPSSEFSHCRAVSMALENLKDPRAAKPLADFLEQPGISGHSFLEIHDVMQRTPPSTTDNSTRNKSLRELILARALYRCGDHNGLGEKILKQYARDFRGHYASHAKAVLQGQ